MIRPILVWSALLSFGVTAPAFADDSEVSAVLDKAIKALGGEEKLAKAGTASWKSKGTITFGDNEGSISSKTVVQGIDRHRAEFEADFNGNAISGVTVIAGDKGWRKFGDNVQDLEGEMLAAEKRRAYMQAGSTHVLPLKGKGFKVEKAPDGKVDDKPTSVVKVTGPDGKDFTISFDKESGLPVKMAGMVAGPQGDEMMVETIYSDYKDFGGVKRATKVETKRDGQPFAKFEISDFKALDKPEADAFAEPK